MDVRGSIFRLTSPTTVTAIAIPVNRVGVAGAGLAKAAAQQWPAWAESYKQHFGKGSKGPHWVTVGDLHVVSVPTKNHWCDPSPWDLVQKSIQELAELAEAQSWKSVAVPALGCGLGGLPWAQVRVEMGRFFDPSPVLFLVFAPG